MKYIKGSVLGSTIQTAELDDASITYAKLGADLEKKELVYSDTLSADTSGTTGTISGTYKYFIVEFGSLEPSGSISLYLTLNGIGGTSYNYTTLTGTTLARPANQAQFAVALVASGESNGFRLVVNGEFIGSAHRCMVASENRLYEGTGPIFGSCTNTTDEAVSIIAWSLSAGSLTGYWKVWGVE